THARYLTAEELTASAPTATEAVPDEVPEAASPVAVVATEPEVSTPAAASARASAAAEVVEVTEITEMAEDGNPVVGDEITVTATEPSVASVSGTEHVASHEPVVPADEEAAAPPQPRCKKSNKSQPGHVRTAAKPDAVPAPETADKECSKVDTAEPAEHDASPRVAVPTASSAADEKKHAATADGPGDAGTDASSPEEGKRNDDDWGIVQPTFGF
ncbi:MAG: hypothetical protein PHQ27_09700, partial [Victivallales bacterium]|nr:hypothetical protein [Victivallales bacterium]